MKHRAFSLIELAVVTAIVLILAAILYPTFVPRHPEGSRGASCRSNLKQIGLAFAQYVHETGEKYPPATLAWGEVLQPYLKNMKLFHCPSVDPQSPAQTIDYWMNARLSGADYEQLTQSTDLTLIVLAGDGLPAQPLGYSLRLLPPAWTNDYRSPANRHLDAANYLFADGHVKALFPERITLQAPSKNQPTFRVKP